MTSGGNRNPANPETGGWMDRMRRRRFTPTASFTHGRGTNPNGSRQVRAQCNSALEDQMHVEVGGHLLVDLDQELLELDGPHAMAKAPHDLAARNVQRGEQAGGAVADVVVTPALGSARPDAGAEGQ